MPARVPIHAADAAITNWVTMMHADMNGGAIRGFPIANISPNSGSIAALLR